MYRIVDKRGSGKTSRLILLAKEHNGIVASQCPAYIIEKAHCYGVMGIKVCSYQDLIDKNYDINLPVFIDDIERFITFCTPNLGGFSMSTNDTGYADIETELIMNKVEMQHNKYMRDI
jgi:hypothetical protein